MAVRNVYPRRVMTHDSTELCNKSINVRVPPRPPWQCWIYLCVTVSLTILPGCQLVKYIVAVMKLFAYNDNTHKISRPKGTLAQLLPINLQHFSVQCWTCSVSQPGLAVQFGSCRLNIKLGRESNN